MPGVISAATSRAIYDDALRAYHDKEHPCHSFRELQHGVPDGFWQLPEPFNGASAKSRIVFLGLNPSYNPAEDVPRLGTSFEDWDHFYRHRLDGDPSTWALLYRRYQVVGEVAVGEHFRLGLEALVLEIVRFRSAKHEGVTDAVLQHELPTTRRMIAEVAPNVIVAVGKDALWVLRNQFPDLQHQLPQHYRMLELEGRIFSTRLEDPESDLRIAAIPHLTGSFGMSRERIRAIGKAVRQTLE